ncbi:hypothetical protein DFQ29_003534, partial [Apophysomyces sp. BC1021]
EKDMTDPEDTKMGDGADIIPPPPSPGTASKEYVENKRLKTDHNGKKNPLSKLNPASITKKSTRSASNSINTRTFALTEALANENES